LRNLSIPGPRSQQVRAGLRRSRPGKSFHNSDRWVGESVDSHEWMRCSDLLKLPDELEEAIVEK
jgi:hypothetical protein